MVGKLCVWRQVSYGDGDGKDEGGRSGTVTGEGGAYCLSAPEALGTEHLVFFNAAAPIVDIQCDQQPLKWYPPFDL